MIALTDVTRTLTESVTCCVNRVGKHGRWQCHAGMGVQRRGEFGFTRRCVRCRQSDDRQYDSAAGSHSLGHEAWSYRIRDRIRFHNWNLFLRELSSGPVALGSQDADRDGRQPDHATFDNAGSRSARHGTVSLGRHSRRSVWWKQQCECSRFG